MICAGNKSLLIAQKVSGKGLKPGLWSAASFVGHKILLASPQGITVYDLEKNEKVRRSSAYVDLCFDAPRLPCSQDGACSQSQGTASFYIQR